MTYNVFGGTLNPTLLLLLINWSKAMVIDREPVRFSRWIKEAVHIRKEGQHAMNQDEGSYQLSHAYDHFLDTASFSRVKNRKNSSTSFF